MSAHGLDPDMSSAAGSGEQASPEDTGLTAWMGRVAEELDRTLSDLNAGAVHDLRVALRRCISIADVHMALDPLEAWGEMRKTGRKLFKNLGELRDVQVMMEWIRRLFGESDAAGIRLEAWLGAREAELCERAARAVAGFDRKRWLRLQDRLARRSPPLLPEDAVYRQFALERWQEAHELHRGALRNRSYASFHRLRIGLKRFRYTVENFLPQRHEIWGGELKRLQDALGEHHDLFVLWKTALRAGVLADRELRARWRERIEIESRARLLVYRSSTIGRESLWPVWRAGLPRERELRLAAEARIRIWASYRDPDFARTLMMAGLALQLFDGLLREGFVDPAAAEDLRCALHAAAIMSNVGKDAGGRKRGKSSYRLIRKTEPPLGFPPGVYALAAPAARCRRSGIRGPAGKHLALLPEARRPGLRLIAAILCLADAFAPGPEQAIGRIEVGRKTDVLVISAAGYREDSDLAREVAAARHPLEVVCRLPILVRPLP